MKNYKILFLDDDPMITMSAALYLKPLCEKIVFTETGEECLEILKKDNDFEIILVDYMLPGMNGVEVLEVIKKDKRTKHIPVLVQTGMLDVPEKEIEENGGLLIKKPYSRTLIEETIAKIIGR